MHSPWHLPNELVHCRPTPAEANWLALRVKEAPAVVWDHVASNGIKPARATADSRLLSRAARDIDLVPDLAAIVRDRTSCIHLLDAPLGFDISHSEPRWQKRIFVSVPDRTDGVGALRFAESVTHEAMHLHLTRYEMQTSLVNDINGMTYSPWRGTNRSYQGVLHGLFVFRCLNSFFTELNKWTFFDCSERTHIENRIQQINAELSQLDLNTLSTGLTDAGRSLCRFLAGV